MGRGAPHRLLKPVGDAPTLEVVGADLYLHPVTGEHAYAVHTHLARVVSQHLVAIVGLDPEGGVFQGLDNRPFEQDALLLGVGIGVGQSAFLLVPLRPGGTAGDPMGALANTLGGHELTGPWPRLGLGLAKAAVPLAARGPGAPLLLRRYPRDGRSGR